MHLLTTIYSTVALLAFLSVCQSVLAAKDRKSRREKRKCPRACLREMFKEINKLKVELEHIKKTVTGNLQRRPGPIGPHGSKGAPGIIGRPGFRGQKGEPGAPGLLQASSGAVFPNLPACANDEFLTSNGKKLFCVKFDLKRNLEDSASLRQPHPPVALNPTLSPGLRSSMTLFERKGMIQSIEGDTWDIGVIQHQSNYYFCSSLLGKAFTVYKWLSTRFWELAKFPIKDARNWKSFSRDGALYIAIASNSNDYSPIYKFIGDEKIVEYQRVPVEGVFDVQPVETDQGFFLVYSSIHGPTSSIFRWNKSKKVFVHHQIVSAYGTDVESFKMNDKTFIAFVAMENGPFINLYQLSNEGNFTKYGSIQDDQKAYSMHYFTIGNEHFLAVARFSNKPSVILRWNGKAFQMHQLIDSCWARGFTSITSSLIGNSHTYLAVANSKCNSAIYAWDAASRTFIKLQETESRLTRDMEFFTMGSHVYLIVSAVQNSNIYRGIVKKSPQ